MAPAPAATRVRLPAARSRRSNSRAASGDSSAAHSGSKRTHWASSSSTLLRAASPTTWKRAGLSPSTSSVLQPTLPVEPRTATPMLMYHPYRSNTHPKPDQSQRHNRGRGGDAVDTIQHTAVARKQPTAVLEAHVALEQTLGQIADDGEGRRGQAQRQKTQRRQRKPGRAAG